MWNISKENQFMSLTIKINYVFANVVDWSNHSSIFYYLTIFINSVNAFKNSWNLKIINTFICPSILVFHFCSSRNNISIFLLSITIPFHFLIAENDQIIKNRLEIWPIHHICKNIMKTSICPGKLRFSVLLFPT